MASFRKTKQDDSKPKRKFARIFPYIKHLNVPRLENIKKKLVIT